MAKFNTKAKKSVKAPKTVNKAGGVAHKMGSEQELTHAVLTTFLESKFYESGDARLKRIQELVAVANPEFVARLAVVARKEFHMRSVTHALLGELAVIYNGDDLVKRAMVASTERPDDLTEIASYVMGRNSGKLTKQVKRGIRNSLLKFNRYQLSKYRGEGNEVSLVDLFNLAHPRVEFATKEQKNAWKDLIKGDLKSEGTWETELSNAEDAVEGKEALEKLVLGNKMGYMALLRNLNNLIKYGVSAKVIKHAAARLSDKDAVKKSKQLPFRFITAYDNVVGSNVLLDAISEAMDHSVSNCPTYKGKTLIAIDESGSMSGNPIKIASVFAAALAKANKNADVIMYATDHREFNVSSRLPVIDIAKKIENSHTGGGTDTSQVFDYAIESGVTYDRVFILSDSESWNDGYRGGSTEALERYKTTGADPFVYAIDIAGYGTKDVDGKKVFHFTGWSERILDFVAHVEKGEGLVEYIRNYEL